MRNAGRWLLTTDAVGGVWTYTMTLAAGLASRGICCTVAVLGPKPDAAQRAAAARIPGLSLIETGLPLDWLAEHPAALADATAGLQAIARSHDVERVHLHAPAYATGEWPAPVVTVVHSCLATWWQAMRSGPLPGEFAWRVAATARGLAAADGVIAPSRAFADALASVYRTDRRIDVVPNGLAPAQPLRATERQGVLAAGRLWDEAKGAATLDVAAGGLTAPVRVAGPLAGPGEARFSPCHLRPLGRLSPASLRDAMALAAIFAAPAYYEPFGLAVLEAAQLGTPLVLSDIASFRELWGEAAVLVPPGDAAAWQAALGTLLADPSRRAELGERARKRAWRYTDQAMVLATMAAHQKRNVALEPV